MRVGSCPDGLHVDVLMPDVKLAAKNHQLSMPVIFPGFSWSNLKSNGRKNQIPRLSADLPSDWYLKLAGDITKMFHGERQPDPKVPHVH